MLRSPGLLQMPVFCTLGGLNIFRIVAQRAAGSLLCCMLAAGQSWAGFFGCPLAFIHGHGHEPRTQGRSPDIIYIYHPISISTVVISCFIQLRTGSCCTSPVTLDHPSTGQWGDTKMSLYRLSGTGLTDRYLKLLMNCSCCSDLLWMVGYKGNKVCSFGLRNVNYILVIS